MIPMTSPKLGRPPKTPVDRLRAQLWYYAVKSRTIMSDYQLDLLFLDRLGKRPSDPQKRIRLFENVRLYGTLPSTGTHPRRDFNLIEIVDLHEDFGGTAEVFNSPFWLLFGPQYQDLSSCHALVQSSLRRLGLLRFSSIAQWGFKGAMKMWNDKQESELQLSSSFIWEGYRLYGVQLRIVLSTLPLSLDLLTLLGALFREAYLACALEVAVEIKNIFYEMLERYIKQDWISPLANVFERQAECRILFMHSYPFMIGNEGIDVYDDYPSEVVQRMIFPVGTEEDFYSDLGLQALEYAKIRANDEDTS